MSHSFATNCLRDRRASALSDPIHGESTDELPGQDTGRVRARGKERRVSSRTGDGCSGRFRHTRHASQKL